MRAIVPALIMCCALLACDTENSARLNSAPANALGEIAFDDQFASTTPTDSLLSVQSNMVGTSANGKTVNLLLRYSIDPAVQNALTARAYVQFDYEAPGQEPLRVARSTIGEQLFGEVEISVPTTEENAKIVASVGGLKPDVIDDVANLEFQLPAVAKRETTDLSQVQGLQAELVEGSYESELVDGRRVHEFAIRVFDPTGSPLLGLLNNTSEQSAFQPTPSQPTPVPYSITGLEKSVSSHFSAFENNVQDIESPVTVSFTEHPLAVYMVIDASKSVVESRQSHHLLDAVSKTTIALSNNAWFDYRTFNGDVHRIDDLTELEFDTGETSATALYYAIDTTLQDIENHGSINQDKIVMVFTDGKDLASRNHYSDQFIDNAQVHEYLVQRVNQTRSSQENTLGKQMQVYTIGFYDSNSGIDATEEIRKLDAIANAGGTQASYNNFNANDIESAFAAVVHNVKGIYYLRYSSQQTSGNNTIELVVTVNGHEARVILPTSMNGLSH